jgi:hypothetical protein
MPAATVPKKWDQLFDFRCDLPAADVQIGLHSHMRIYGFSDIEPRLVEVRWSGLLRDLHLTVDQADAIARGLILAAAKARGCGQ